MNAFIHLLTNPAILSLLGGIALGLYATVQFPKWINELVAIYLIFTIGFKGGACLGVANQCSPPLILLATIGVLLGFIKPFLFNVILKKITTLDESTIAVIAAQYGSISIVTFITAISFLNDQYISYDTFMMALAGIMEVPALCSGLWLIQKHKIGPSHKKNIFSLLNITKAIFTDKKISVMFLGFFVGWAAEIVQMKVIESVVVTPFTLMLILLMIDIGIKIAHQKQHLAEFKWPLIAFGIGMPICTATVGLFIALSIGTNLGSSILFAVLLSSASYIAVPAIMGAQAHEAKQVIYLPLALGITLPFNLMIGIPLYYYVGRTIQFMFF